ncbi:MAG: hypothetical protein V3T83_16550 [Acidobacteriota bacterium]
MTSLSTVFQVLNEMKSAAVFEDYALGGAMAALFYAEPLRTYDLDVFVLLPRQQGIILQLTPIYKWLEERGFHPDAEHVLIHGVPVQFLPVHNDLAEEAVQKAQELDYEGVAVQVAGPDYLIALGLQAGGRKRRERSILLLESGAVDEQRLKALLERHHLPTEILNQ